MKVFVHERINNYVEKDEKLSKANYRLKKGYSINNLILENDYYEIVAFKIYYLLFII